VRSSRLTSGIGLFATFSCPTRSASSSRSSSTIPSPVGGVRARSLRATGGAALRIGLQGANAAARVDRLRAAVASYSGHLRHGQAWRQWIQAWEQCVWLGALFSRRGWQVEERWPQRRIACARRFQEQYWLLVCRAGLACLVFCQVGRFVEFRGPQRRLAEHVLRLRTTYLPRAGYALAVGFPGWLRRYYEARALREGFGVAVVRETGDRVEGCKCRRVVEVAVPQMGQFEVKGGAPTGARD